MSRVILLVFAGLGLVAASYQMLAADSIAIADGRADRSQLEIVTRNAAFTAFTRAKRLVEAAEGFEQFTGPGKQLRGSYDGTAYRARIVSSGERVTIYSSAVTTTGADTVDFAVSAEVEWASDPTGGSGAIADRYLVLRAYHEE